jgi:integrase
MRDDKRSDRAKYLYRRTIKGKSYIYFRMADGALVPLPPDIGSEAFRLSYDECIKARVKTPSAPTKPKPINATGIAFIGDTIGAAIKAYKTSTEFDQNKVSTKKVYDEKLDQIAQRIGLTHLRDLDVDAVDRYTDLVTQEIGAATADQHLALLSNIWKVCRRNPDFRIKGLPNPTVDAARRYTKARNPAKPWPDHVLDDFMATAPEHLRQGKVLLHFSAQRGGDAVKMQWKDFDGEGILVIPEKGDDLEIANWHKCPAPLLTMLKRMQKDRRPEPTDHILLNYWGKPWSSAQALSHAIRDHLILIGHAKRGTKTWTMHGLRKNAASEVGELLKGTAGIKSVTGHVSDEMAEFYAKHANQIAMNREVVAAWDQKIAEREASKVKRRRASLKRIK